MTQSGYVMQPYPCCRLLSIEVKVSGIKCHFKILLAKGYASILRHRLKTSGHNILPVAFTLTSGIHCVVVFHLIVLEFGVGQLKLKNNLKTNLYVGQQY